jgi:serine acetyltransferase
MPFNSVVVGIPGRVTNKKKNPQTRKPDLNHGKPPDMIE